MSICLPVPHNVGVDTLAGGVLDQIEVGLRRRPGSLLWVNMDVVEDRQDGGLVMGQ